MLLRDFEPAVLNLIAKVKMNTLSSEDSTELQINVIKEESMNKAISESFPIWQLNNELKGNKRSIRNNNKDEQWKIILFKKLKTHSHFWWKMKVGISRKVESSRFAVGTVGSTLYQAHFGRNGFKQGFCEKFK